MATILCAWYQVNNPERDPEKEDLNLTVNGVVQLTEAEVRRLAAEAGGLLPINATVMDSDTVFDDTIFTTPFSFMLGVHNTDPTSFGFPAIVPHQSLTDCEPGYEHFAEVYCKVVAQHTVGGQVIFAARKNTETHDVRIRNE
jgi:hypothetical protein